MIITEITIDKNLGRDGRIRANASKGVPDLPPPSVIHSWIQFFELNTLISYMTTSDPNLATSSQLPTGAADPAVSYMVGLRTSS